MEAAGMINLRSKILNATVYTTDWQHDHLSLNQYLIPRMYQ